MNKINETLQKQGRTKKWLAEQVGVTPKTIENWCKSESKLPAFKIQMVADVLNVEPNYLQP